MKDNIYTGSKYDTIDKCEKEIVRLSKHLLMLKAHKQDICTHDVIKLEGFCDDDYAYSKTYTHYLTCQQCGLQGREDNEGKSDESYKKLSELYKNTKWQDREYVRDRETNNSYNIAYRKGKPNGKST